MLVVRVELRPPFGPPREIARMAIANDGTGTPARGNYDGRSGRRPTFRTEARRGRVEGHARRSLSVWCLVRKMLQNMGY